MDTLIFEVGTALVLVAIAAVIAGKFKFSVIPFFNCSWDVSGATCADNWCDRFQVY